MATYLDVRVVQVQAYLTRARHLRARRGASALVTSALKPSDNTLQDLGASRNPSAGNVDGHLSVELTDPASPEQVAQRLLTAVRKALPNADLEALWGSGDSYVEAYGTLGAGLNRIDAPAVEGEFPGARRCQLCGLDAAVAAVAVTGEGNRAACADCQSRYQAGLDPTGKGQGSQSAQQSTEQRLHDALDRPEPSSYAQDFVALARLGVREHNHLATVYIDGNAIGAFFGKLAQMGDEHVASISRQLAEATWGSLVEAARKVGRDGEPVPVVPHIAGGDDVLVSLPAERAWPFTVAFLEEFRTRATKLSPPSVSPPTATAGLLFAHASHPFDRCRAAVEELVNDAKRQVSGSEFGALWADVTREGERPPVARRVWILDDLKEDGFGRSLIELANLPQSTRAGLRRAVAHPDDDVAAAYARRQASRLRGGIPAVAAALNDGTGRLRDALELARWWPRTSKETT